ncbi:FAD-dependent oxidoreductase [Naasia sp. SYSU D00948]|uniref:FAD-dependent oxidoreductase n=1 Tax=Naasia sp. SYSU D00948 TaxID=2817379 RepID=UPI0027DCE2C1|nr:FAD-dependent oxidoreductase [Naasia sp. SYSU D00948]
MTASGPLRVVVLGYGPVGARLVEELLPAVRRGTAALTVVGAEEEDAYNRVLLAEYAVGRAARERLDVTDTAAARAAGADIRLGAAALGIDRVRRVVRLEGGESLPYDRLVFATGSRANVPTLGGLETARRARSAPPAGSAVLDQGPAPLPRGVVALRDLRDAEVVLEAVRDRRRIVVLGAGVLGMEVALAAREQGAEVSVVYHGDVPMARNLDTGGGRMLARAARAAGVPMVAHARAESVLTRTDDDGRQRFAALLCADGKEIAGDLLLLSCGVSGRAELAAASGLPVSTGVLVDEDLRSWGDDRVFAIGDCAHVASPGSATPDGRVPGGPAGLIGPGWRQADRLARRLIGEAEDRTASAVPLLPDERPAVVMLKAESVDVVAGGAVTAEPWDDPDPEPTSHAAGCPARHERQVAVWSDPAHGGYLKMVTRDGVLEGFVAVGLPRAAAELTLLFERGDELPADRTALLRLDAPDAQSISTSDPFAPESTVCWCNGVTAAAIGDAVSAGSTTVECVGAATRAGTGCGGCKGRIAELLARLGPAVPTG